MDVARGLGTANAPIDPFGAHSLGAQTHHTVSSKRPAPAQRSGR
jgi:hypothetical protein